MLGLKSNHVSNKCYWCSLCSAWSLEISCTDMCLDIGFSEWTSYHETLNVTTGILESGPTEMNCPMIVLTTFDNDIEDIYFGNAVLCLCLELRTHVIPYDNVKFRKVWKNVYYYELGQLLSSNSWLNIITSVSCIGFVFQIMALYLVCIWYWRFIFRLLH